MYLLCHFSVVSAQGWLTALKSLGWSSLGEVTEQAGSPVVMPFLTGEFIPHKFSQSSRNGNCRAPQATSPTLGCPALAQSHLAPDPHPPASNVSLFLLRAIWWLTRSHLATHGCEPDCKQKVTQAFLTWDVANDNSDRFGAPSPSLPHVSHPSMGRRCGGAEELRLGHNGTAGMRAGGRKSRISCYLQNTQLHYVLRTGLNYESNKFGLEKTEYSRRRGNCQWPIYGCYNSVSICPYNKINPHYYTLTLQLEGGRHSQSIHLQLAAVCNRGCWRRWWRLPLESVGEERGQRGR